MERSVWENESERSSMLMSLMMASGIYFLVFFFFFFMCALILIHCTEQMTASVILLNTDSVLAPIYLLFILNAHLFILGGWSIEDHPTILRERERERERERARERVFPIHEQFSTIV